MKTKPKRLSKLHETILTRYGSVTAFAKAHKLDGKRLNKQILGTIRMKESDIIILSQILGIEKESVVDYFLPDFLRGKIQHKGKLL